MTLPINVVGARPRRPSGPVPADVWRLLQQATFGPTYAEAQRVQSLGVSGWIDDQFTKPVSGYPDTKYNRIQLKTTPDCTTNDPNGVAYPADHPYAICVRDHLSLAMVQRDFFINAVYAPDQLRQRVAWALSQIIVTSANEPDLSYAHVMSRYQNLMFNNAFGNYETLLQQVTFNPAMGNYLDAVNNDRASGTQGAERELRPRDHAAVLGRPERAQPGRQRRSSTSTACRSRRTTRTTSRNSPRCSRGSRTPIRRTRRRRRRPRRTACTTRCR